MTLKAPGRAGKAGPFLAILAILSLAALPLPAQELAPQAAEPKVDGLVSPGEYGYEAAYAGMRLSAALSSDGKILHLALAAPTKGWAAIGLGSRRMDGAHMVLGYEASGKAAVSEEKGKGHGHSPTQDKRLLSSAVKESGDTTVLEFSLPLADLAPSGKLPLIIAYGARDDFRSMHSKYGSFDLPLKR